ncbi:hypothetical protein [Burkholderia multivorans]|uniref:hypothetical protein n=1 Tax=Burkholderia multivorans TaxID=87883 RepID=UPI0004F69DE5|nr:hypothetical protein [Burkholderia multivorans]AIO75326.1 hypothetical protein DM80_3050 [Burkholderia multivorans]
MAIPTESEFTRCLAKIDEYPLNVIGYSDRNPCCGWEAAIVDDYVVDNNFKKFKSRNIKECEAPLIFVWDRLSERRRDIFDSEVMRWLLASPEYLRVYNKLFPKGFRVVPEGEIAILRQEFVSWAFERLCKAANWEAKTRTRSVPAYYISERNRIFEDQKDGFRWIRGIISAIMEYHYSNSAELMLEQKKTYKERIIKAIAGIDSLRSLAGDDVVARLMRNLYDGRDLLTQFKGSQGRLERMDNLRQCLSDMLEVDPDALYPISRLDGTARARIFVYRMAGVNWREFKSYKPAQIADLMYMEGFDVQIEQRTIERQCSNFMSMDRKYWTQVEGTRGGAAYMERLAEWRRLLDKNRK